MAGHGPGRCRESHPLVDGGAQCVREAGHRVVPHQTARGFTWSVAPSTPCVRAPWGRKCTLNEGHDGDHVLAPVRMPSMKNDTPTPPVDLVNHPPHYTGHPSGLEAITITRRMPFDLGNAVKYVWRAPDKGNELQDLEKSVWYLQDQIHEFGSTWVTWTPRVAEDLHRVADAEDRRGRTYRSAYFRSIAAGDLRGALSVAQDMVHALQTGTNR